MMTTIECQVFPLPIQGTPDGLEVQIPDLSRHGPAGVTIISASETPRHVPGSEETTATILVPLGEFDFFGVRYFTEAAAGHMVANHRAVTFDLSVVSFCDSAIGSFFDWVDRLADDLAVTVVTGPAVERVLDLLRDGWVDRSPSLIQ